MSSYMDTYVSILLNLGIFAQTAESYFSGFWDVTRNRARPEQGGTASTVDFPKVISMAAFDPLRTLVVLTKEPSRTHRKGS
jgi:hypothetical protein